jgi:hypothetical protein
MLWDLAEGKRLYSLDAGDIIHALVFSPNRYWLCAATQVRESWTLCCAVPAWFPFLCRKYVPLLRPQRMLRRWAVQ